MSLPVPFEEETGYFEACLQFFQKYQHLYNFENTRVLTQGVFRAIDLQNLDNEDLFSTEFSLHSVQHRNDYVKRFLNECDQLKTERCGYIEDVELEKSISVPLGRKKKHEIVYLAREIENVCEATGCTTVVDFGSGLGYLDQLIYERSNYKVLGIECNSQHYVNAKKRQRKYHEGSLRSVKYKKHTISSTSDIAISEYLNEKFCDVGNICITGLHACADLTVEAVSLFLKIPEAKALVLMPCCYHKMSLLDDKEKVLFRNFPLSCGLKNIFSIYRGYEFLRIPFLRLSCQPPFVGESLKDLVFNLLTRALLQLYADRYDYKLTRRKRKAVKTKTMERDFAAYIQSAKENFTISCKNQPCPNDAEGGFSTAGTSGNICKCNIEFNMAELKQLWRDECDAMTFRKAAMFVLLQRHLQPIFENFVLYDRLVYLREAGVKRCSYKQIVDENVSPRCSALIVVK